MSLVTSKLPGPVEFLGLPEPSMIPWLLLLIIVSPPFFSLEDIAI